MTNKNFVYFFILLLLVSCGLKRYPLTPPGRSVDPIIERYKYKKNNKHRKKSKLKAKKDGKNQEKELRN